jgi:DNA-binding CsgD family transcriptional regulator/tetratricopeptide (TPR) repeat protein
MIEAMRLPASRSFVGRAAELAALDAALSAASEGEPSVALVGGEAGVGKTRLVAELGARAAGGGAAVAVGGSVELTAGAAPYLAFTEALRDLERAAGARAWQRLSAGAPPELAALLPGAPAATPARGDAAARVRLLGQMQDLLGTAATAAPLLLVLEDVHWADRSTLDLAGFLARSLRGERVLLVATFRSDETARRPLLREWLGELARLDRVRRLELAPFGEAEVGELLAGILGQAPDAATTARIAHRSGGNAFLAEELLGADEAVPSSVRDLLDARIAALPAAAQEVLRAAAAAGARVDDELLAALVAFDPADAVRAAVAHHLLAADPRDGRLAFRHELVREAAYAELLPSERRRLHATCAELLTARPELGGEGAAATAAAIARHWDAAGEPAHALAASARAAAAAEGVHAVSEALLLYERALALWDGVPDAETVTGMTRLDLLERTAQIAVPAGDAGRAVTLLDAALALADPAAEPVRTGVLHSQRAWCGWPAGAAGPATYDHHAAALELIPAEPPSPARARAVTDLAYSDMLDGRQQAASEHATEAVAVARRADAREIEGLALNVLGASLGALGRSDEAIAALREAVAIAHETGGSETLGRAYVNLSSTLDTSGRYEEAVAAALEGEQACRRLGMTGYWGAFLAGNAAESLIMLGRLDEAEAIVAAAEPQAVSDLARVQLTILRAELALQRGDPAACEAALTDAHALNVVAHSAEMAGVTMRVSAELSLSLGRLDGARAAVGAGFERLGDDARVVAALVSAGVATEAAAAERARATGNDAEAAIAAAAARGLLGRLDELGPGAAVAAARGHVLTARAEATRLGEPDPAAWRAAAEAWEAMPCPYQAGWARLREAQALLDAGAGRPAASAALRAAAAVAGELRAGTLQREVELLAARARIDLAAPAPPREKEPVAGGLTPREVEVLAHVAAGRTNRQIADALYISPRTAGVHVSRILAKLGAATRGEAAAAGRLAGVIDTESVENLMRLTHPRKLG